METIKLYKSPWRAIKLILLCSIFVVTGIFLIVTDDDPKWIAWLAIGFLGLGYPIGLFHLLDRRPQIIIDEIGIYDRTNKQGPIGWEYIRNAYLTNIHGQKFICLVLSDAYKPSWEEKKWQKKLAKLNKEMGFQEVNITLGQIRTDEKKLMKFIIKMGKATDSQKKRLLQKLASEL